MTDEKHENQNDELKELTDMEKFENVTKLLKEHNREGFREELMANHTYEQAQIYVNLDAKQRQIANGYLTPYELASIYDVFDEDTFKEIISFLANMDDRRASAILEEMYRDNAADILQEIKPTKAQIYLRLMPKGQADELKVLMQYEDDTAGSIMTTDFVSLQANQTVKSAMTLVRSKANVAETIYYLYVVDDNNRIVGVVTLRDMMLADANEFVSDIMSERVVAVNVHDDQEIVAQVIRDYDFMAIPVTEYTGELVGIITVDDILDVMDEEALEDYSGLAAVDVDEVHETSVQAAAGRLPWLITLLFLGMGTATLIGRFEGLISEVATLSLFITLVTGTAGNAGTQSLAVAVRRLAMPKEEHSGFLRMIIHEVVIGLISGLATGVTIFLIITIWQRNLALAGVVGIAMLSAITVANLAGSLVPMLMDKLGFDPAVASGPFITTLSDLTSVLIYFSVATQFMPFLV